MRLVRVAPYVTSLFVLAWPTMRIFLAGATGVIGCRLLPALVSAGHSVVAMTRRTDRCEALTRQGGAPVVCDVFDADAVRHAIVAARPDVVIHQLTSIPKRINPRRIDRDLAENSRIRTIGTRHLVDGAVAAGATQFIAQSICFTYQPSGEGLKTEDDALFTNAPKRFRGVIESAADLESLTCTTPGIRGTVLRYGMFYGPGSIYDEGGSFWLDVKARRLPIVGKGSGVWSFIHVDDAVRATILALGDTPAGIYNIVDDTPIASNEFIRAYAALLKAKSPRWAPRWAARIGGGAYAVYLMETMRGASNAKARRILNFEPMYPRTLDGFKREVDKAG